MLFSPLKHSARCTHRQVDHYKNSAALLIILVTCGLRMLLGINNDYSLHSVSQFVFVTEMRCGICTVGIEIEILFALSCCFIGLNACLIMKILNIAVTYNGLPNVKFVLLLTNTRFEVPQW